MAPKYRDVTRRAWVTPETHSTPLAVKEDRSFFLGVLHQLWMLCLDSKYGRGQTRRSSGDIGERDFGFFRFEVTFKQVLFAGPGGLNHLIFDRSPENVRVVVSEPQVSEIHRGIIGRVGHLGHLNVLKYRSPSAVRAPE